MTKSALASLMLFGTSALFVFSAIHASITPGQAGESDTVYGELLELRKSIGGSVLRGTSLAPSPEAAEREFRDTLKRTVNKNSPALPPDLNRSDAADPPASVVTLRLQGSKLDRIADAIEQLREYAHADALRESADTLRNLARQLDSQPTEDAESKPSSDWRLKSPPHDESPIAPAEPTQAR